MDNWDQLRWFIVLNGIADAYLWGFDADGWRLRHGNPANGMLAVLPNGDDGPVATLDDATWLADALAFDHDAPVGIQPAVEGVWPYTAPKDPAAIVSNQPVTPLDGGLTSYYWDSVNTAHLAAADLRFNTSYCIRYGLDDPDPGTDFGARFAGRETSLALYAMATRQADILAEYLCLYRVLEGADSGNGKSFAAEMLPGLVDRDYGVLRVMTDFWHDGHQMFTNAFGLYRHRARLELLNLEHEDVTDVPAYLYAIRNAIAHGKTEVLTGGHGESFAAAGRALPIVKLLARSAVEQQ